ncbi:MAG: pyridoxal phosphate-dependent decarboxylase family protein [Phycisphaerae bacterium]|jgi:glutamate/tyrosine decarboxylase-like PLP-dependent enzyme
MPETQIAGDLSHTLAQMSAWFAGPKAENGDWFTASLTSIAHDYYSWRRNYFPEDGVIIDSRMRREAEDFQDAFNDRLLELLARLKGDFPFQSPRYAAHMVAEQTLPSIAGYFAAMLYNPNNVSADSAPVTVRLELEACAMIAKMLGYGPESWSHLTSGGTLANIEALWMARTVKYLPLVVADMREQLALPAMPQGSKLEKLHMSPDASLHALAQVFDDAYASFGKSDDTVARCIRAYVDSPHNVVEQGLARIVRALDSSPVLLVPETHHYCFEKALDTLGIGRGAIWPVAVDAEFRMRVDDLEAVLQRVEDAGDHVLAVVAVVGTTEEGAVDPVDEILQLRSARERARLGSFWLHADGAYGGYLRTLTIPSRIGLGAPVTTARLNGREVELPLKLPEHSACNALERLGECDSITIDPHKLGYIPYPAGAICFKSNLVKPIARQDAPYIEGTPRDVQYERTSQSIGLYVLEGSKPGAAAAGVWLSHSLIPLDNTGHGVLIRETVRNACELHALLEQYAEHVATPMRAICVCPPGSNIVCYAFMPANNLATLAQINELNRRLFARFTLEDGQRVYDQRFFVSRTTLAPSRYAAETVAPFLTRLNVTPQAYEHAGGVFLLRSTLMNPWYSPAKKRGRYFLSELVAELFAAAEQEWKAISASQLSEVLMTP